MAGEKLLDDEFLSRIEQLELVSRRLVLGRLKGDRLSKRRGWSIEFADFRPYVAGDDLRFLDWNIYGRLDRLFLKVFLEEEDFQINLLVDSSLSMDYGNPDKFLYARRIVAALGYIGLIHQDRVSVHCIGSGLNSVFGPSRGRRQAPRMLTTVEALRPSSGAPTHLYRALKEYAYLGRRGGVIVVVSDLLDRHGVKDLVRQLSIAGRAAEVFLFHVLSPQEVNPELAGDLKLVDCEDGIEADVTISAPLLKAYKRNLDQFCAEIRTECVRRDLHYIPALTSTPFDRLLLGYLRRRGLLR